MLKSSGLKIPGRGPKHSSPVGRTSAGSAAVPKDSKDAGANARRVLGSGV